MKLLPNKYIIQKENMYGKKWRVYFLNIQTVLEKSPTNRMKRKLESMKKIFKIFIFKKEFTLHDTHRSSKI